MTRLNGAVSALQPKGAESSSSVSSKTLPDGTEFLTWKFMGFVHW